MWIDTKRDKLQENYFFNKYGRAFPKIGVNRKALMAAVVLVLLICYRLLFAAPADFPAKEVVAIPSGASLVFASTILAENSIIRSPILFRMMVRVLDGQTGVKAGDYLFEDRQNLFTIARRMVSGERGYASVQAVVPEGTSAEGIAGILGANIPDFDTAAFIKIAKPNEGHLFPDTYHFSFDAKPEFVLKTFLDNFNRKVESVRSDIDKFGRPLEDIIKMASIVEEEGRTMETRKMIAGILWKRLDIGMPLQVDASFLYINGKNTFQLTTADLQKDSAYNTYTRAGLPPTAISNPGLDAILATVNPTKSPYLYYLTDHDGVMRYAKTHDEHVINKAKYLK
ncbi:MAG: endolytic transglycosylase MltG [Candidatus Taylorbacteria bacterium]|nr:endolytic transglycosylase MltG [Candidatus Taylorbacteria bacterium]